MVVPGRSLGDQVVVKIFVLIPFVALIAAVPIAGGWGLGWTDLGLAAGFYLVACLGTTVGYHRYFWHAHMGWLFERVTTNAERFAPDLLADRDLRVIDRLFPLWMGLSLGLPAALGGVIIWSWWGAVTAFFLAGLVRVAVLHHVTWSINSIRHMIGDRPFGLPRPSRELLALGDPVHGASPGTTPTTPTPPAPAMASSKDRSTSPPESAGHSRNSAGPPGSAEPTRNAWPASPPEPDRRGHNTAPAEEKP